MYNTELSPTFYERLKNEDLKNILIAGCGGGYDFLHGMLLYHQLLELGKKIIIHSFSFTNIDSIKENYENIYNSGKAVVKKVNSKSISELTYCPEIHLCDFLDKEYKDGQKHEVYASNARQFTVPQLTDFYKNLVEKENIDAILLIDGGSDSLMKGDEEGLGDPIEDAVSLCAISQLNIKEKILINIGLGCDRFNHVSDASSLRAISEAIEANAYLGAFHFYKGTKGFEFYKFCIDYISDKQNWHSIVSESIISASQGFFGSKEVPKRLQSRANDQVYLWPLMSIMWTHDLDFFAGRSLICEWIKNEKSTLECHLALERGRHRIENKIREVENLPKHEEYRDNSDEDYI